MKTIITTIFILMSVLSSTNLKAQTCGYNTNLNSTSNSTQLYYRCAKCGKLIAVNNENNAPQTSNIEIVPLNNGNINLRNQPSFVNQPNTNSTQSFELDINEQSPNNNFPAYNENTQRQSQYNIVPQQKTLIQKINRGVQVVNAFGQIANAVQTIVNPNVSYN